MSVRLVGNVVKDGYDHWFRVMGWIKNGSLTSDFNAVPITNTIARRGAEVLIEKNVPERVSPWVLYEYNCEQNDSKIKDFNLLKNVKAKPVIYGESFWTLMQGGLFCLNYEKVKTYLDGELLDEAFILKDSFVYGIFDGKESCVKKYSIRKENLLLQNDNVGRIRFGFICESSLNEIPEKIDCSSFEQLKKWFENEFELDINRFLNAELNLLNLDKIRWMRVRGLIDEFILQEKDLLGVFERTRNSGFGKIIVETAKKAIKDDYTKELADSDDTIRSLVEKKRGVENEIRALEEKKKDVEHDIEQDALQRKAQLEREFNELNSTKSELEKECAELSGAKDQKEEEIKKIEEKITLLEAEKKRIAEENNQKVNSLEKALQNVKEKYSDLLNDLKVIALEKDDGEEPLLPIYENDEDVNGAEEEWDGIPRASIVESIKQVYRRVEDCGPCKVYELHVEHDWLHYSDFVNHGLIKIWKEAASNSEIHFILVLDSLNLTRPECGMKPLLDSLKYDVPLLGTNLERPENLKIMATLLPKEGEGGVGLDISAVINWPEY